MKRMNKRMIWINQKETKEFHCQTMIIFCVSCKSFIPCFLLVYTFCINPEKICMFRINKQYMFFSRKTDKAINTRFLKKKILDFDPKKLYINCRGQRKTIVWHYCIFRGENTVSELDIQFYSIFIYYWFYRFWALSPVVLKLFQRKKPCVQFASFLTPKRRFPS